MRKQLFPRILAILLIYCVFFTAMAAVQFKNREGRENAVPDYFNLALPEAENSEAFAERIRLFRNANFSLWSRTIRDQNDEDLAAAFLTEALNRGSYEDALAALPSVFLRSPERTGELSVYVGGLAQAHISLAAREEERLSFISRLTSGGSIEFLKEPNVFQFLAIHGRFDLMDGGAELAGAIDSASIPLDIALGIFEGYSDWAALRPSSANPFSELADAAFSAVLESCKTVSAEGMPELLFAFQENRGDVKFNLRLGKAVLRYSETAGAGNYFAAGIGRSLIFSSISLGNDSGSAAEALLITETAGAVEIHESRNRIGNAELYRILNPAPFFPKAVNFATGEGGIWAWTAAENVRLSRQNNALQISVSFPEQETHYMIFRGIPQFSRIEIYEIPYRSAPDFENWDSPGWVYLAQEQTLLLKMKHRFLEEHISIFF